jgi:hypothetical protein
MVMPCPERLAHGMGAGGGSGRQGPKRMLPLAPLYKYPGMAGVCVLLCMCVLLGMWYVFVLLGIARSQYRPVSVTLLLN